MVLHNFPSLFLSCSSEREQTRPSLKWTAHFSANLKTSSNSITVGSSIHATSAAHSVHQARRISLDFRFNDTTVAVSFMVMVRFFRRTVLSKKNCENFGSGV